MSLSRLSLSILLAGLVAAAGCTTTRQAEEPPQLFNVLSLGGSDDLRRGAPPPSFDEIRVPPPEKEGPEEMTEIRREGLREAALSYASQMGFARRMWEIEGVLEKRSTALSQTYEFSRVAIPAPRKVGFIIPPVVARAFSSYTVEGDRQAASAADEYLEIVAPAHLAPVVPSWRDYLLFSAPVPELPPSSLRPRDKHEATLYEKWLAEGWSAGVELADETFEERLNRLERDFEGMLQYRGLVAMNMIDEMVVADADFGTVVEEDGATMRIGERSVSIVSTARLVGDSRRWKPIVVNARWSEMVERGSIQPEAAPGRIRPGAARGL